MTPRFEGFYKLITFSISCDFFVIVKPLLASQKVIGTCSCIVGNCLVFCCCGGPKMSHLPRCGGKVMNHLQTHCSWPPFQITIMHFDEFNNVVLDGKWADRGFSRLICRGFHMVVLGWARKVVLCNRQILLVALFYYLLFCIIIMPLIFFVWKKCCFWGIILLLFCIISSRKPPFEKRWWISSK